MIDPRHPALLRELGADRVVHSKRTLLEHLEGTHALLESWGNPPAVCTAGLFHSIYGTYVFAHACVDLDRRGEIRARIGAGAERLAFLFCVSERSDFFAEPEGGLVPVRDLVQGETRRIDAATVAGLLEIEAANVVEHLPRRGRGTRASFAWYRDAFAARRERLSEGAAAAVLGALDEHALPAMRGGRAAATVDSAHAAD